MEVSGQFHTRNHF